jgi:hypothetical protein
MLQMLAADYHRTIADAKLLSSRICSEEAEAKQLELTANDGSQVCSVRQIVAMRRVHIESDKIELQAETCKASDLLEEIKQRHGKDVSAFLSESKLKEL